MLKLCASNKKGVIKPFKWRAGDNCPKSPKCCLKKPVFSTKHDLARSCFQLWPIIGDEGDNISKNNCLLKIFSQEDFALKSKLRPAKFLLHRLSRFFSLEIRVNFGRP